MRLRTLISTLAALLSAGALAVLSSGCGSGDAAATLDPIAQAAEVTDNSGGSQLAMTATMTVPGAPGPITITGGGHFNNARREGSLTVQIGGLPTGKVPGLSGGSLTMRELMKNYVIYISSPLFEGKLPNGAKWLEVDLNKAFSSLGIDPQSLASGGTDPSQILGYLKGSTGQPKVVGQEKVRGVETTHYDGTVSLDDIVDKLPAAQRAKAREGIDKLSQEMGGKTSYPVSVWIDAHHLVRRMTMEMNFSISGESTSMTMQIEDFDFGPTPAVVVPSSSETFDGTSLSTQGLASAG